MASIYKLYSLVNGEIYIGSTTKHLEVRLAQHVIAFHEKKNITSGIIIATGNYRIELIEECPLEERYIREQFYILTEKNVVNRNSAYTGIKGNQNDKKEWAAYQREHYRLNRQAHMARKKRYYHAVKKIQNNHIKFFKELPFN